MAYEQHQTSAAGMVARCAIITLSDTRTPETDTSGEEIRRLLAEAGHTIIERHLIPDDGPRLLAIVERCCDNVEVDVLLTTGGTGISRRDCTVATLEPKLSPTLPGFGELFRMLSWNQIGSGAMLSRATAGLYSGRLVFCMPGSTNAVRLAMTELVLPELKHLLHELRK